MSDSAEEIIESLREKLPEHTFDAVMRRADALSASDRIDLLRRILEERERSEAPPPKR